MYLKSHYYLKLQVFLIQNFLLASPKEKFADSIHVNNRTYVAKSVVNKKILHLSCLCENYMPLL